MLKQSIKVTIATASGGEIVFDDSQAPGAGTSAYGQLGHDIRIVADDGSETFINRDCVCSAVIEKTTSEEAVSDDTCPSGEESE